MGSDRDPHELVQVIFDLEREFGSKVDFLVFCRKGLKSQLPKSVDQITIQEVICMGENPLAAIRRKKKSSICVGLDLLKRKKIDALVSAGNTGALIAGAVAKLGLICPGLRPALLALMPTKKGEMAVLDVGANISLKAKHLVQFAFLGAAFQKLNGIKKPIVGLLNIGSEARKGTAEVRKAFLELKKLKTDKFIFAGNREGKNVFDGDIQVLVTEGFTGNIFLKTCEGMANFILSETASCKFKNSEEYSGGILCGVKGLVIKCHGDAGPNAFKSAVAKAIKLIGMDFVDSLVFFLGKD